MAQLVARFLHTEEVIGSSPVSPTQNVTREGAPVKPILFVGVVALGVHSDGLHGITSSPGTGAHGDGDRSTCTGAHGDGDRNTGACPGANTLTAGGRR